jgi:SAM-dependent methyltransferase
MSSSLFPHLVKKFDGDPDVDQLQNGHFRSHRYLAGNLRPLQAAVTLTLAGAELQCELIDLSERGISIRWNGEPPADTVVNLQVCFDGYLLFKGAARIVSVGERQGAKALAFDFAGPAINVPELLDLRAIKQWQSTASGGKAQRTPGHEVFKAQIAELSLLLRDAQQELSKLEQSQPWTSLAAEDDHGSIAGQAFIDSLRSTFVKSALSLMEKIDIEGGAALDGLRSFSHRFIHSFLMESPVMRRAAEKPLGYPGDSHVMSAIQGQQVEGTALFAKAMSLLFNELPFARAMRSRGLFIQNSLRRSISAHAGPVRVFAIAPGSAGELLALVSSLEKGVRVDVVVVDHDGTSLTHIHERVQQLKKDRPDSSVTFTLRHEGVKHLLNDPGAMDGFGEFDFIYSTTLFDYLRPQTFTALTQLLCARLKPQGTLLLAGLSPNLWDRWLLELHLDWKLFYRTPEELLSLATKAMPDLDSNLLEAPDGNVFVKLTS